MREKFFGRGGIFLGFIFIAAVASIAVSSFSSYPVAYTRLWQLFTPMTLYLFLANGPLETRRLMQIAVWGIGASAVMQACIAIPQYFLQRSLGLRILGEIPLILGFTGVASGRTCLLDFFHSASHQSDIYRASGTMPHFNVLGGFCVLALFAISYLYLKRPNQRIWIAIAYLILLFTMATTYSRAAIYAWCIGTIFYLVWVSWRQKIKIQTLSMSIIVSLVFVGTIFHEQYLRRGGIVNYNEGTRLSDSLRMSYHQIAFRMIEKSPWLGVGYGQFSCKSVPFLDKGADLNIAASGVHNIYLRLGAETGLISLAVFLAWILLIFRAGWRAPPTLESGFLLAAFLAFLFIGCCDQYLIVYQQGTLMFFTVAGLLARHGKFETMNTFRKLHVYDR